VANSLYKFHLRTSLSLYYHLPDGTAGRMPSGRSAAMENVAIVAMQVSFCFTCAHCSYSRHLFTSIVALIGSFVCVYFLLRLFNLCLLYLFIYFVLGYYIRW